MDHRGLQLVAAAGIAAGGLAFGGGMGAVWADTGGAVQHDAAGPHSSGRTRSAEGKCSHESCERVIGGVGSLQGPGGGPWGHGHRFGWQSLWAVPAVLPPKPQLKPPKIVGATTRPEVVQVSKVPAQAPRRMSGTPVPLNREPSPSFRGPAPGVKAVIPGMPPLRPGYSEHLRGGGVAEIAAVAIPGAAGILMLSAGGGFIGYRQAKAGHAVRTEGIARFLR